MGNTRFTCGDSEFSTCPHPRKEGFIRNEKGENQFQVLICQSCFGVVASNRIETEKPKSKKAEKAKAEPTDRENGNSSDGTSSAVSTAAASPSKKEAVESDPREKLVSTLEAEGKTAVDIILALKANLGMTNAGAAAYLSQRASEKAKRLAEQQEPVPAGEPEAPVVPVPLSEAHQAEREASLVKPRQIREIPQQQASYPINFFELVPESRSYRFKLHNAEGVEFVFETTPKPEKYEAVSKNPGVFEGRELVFSFSKLDDSECPVEPVLIGVR
jgi:hypothetical protein